ncbi:MAG: hypothetical protein QNL62_03890 [Gammaproteobacteria bacterium]|nr:hypothetical protein [Gammaproteobacteria bacterium]
MQWQELQDWQSNMQKWWLIRLNMLMITTCNDSDVHEDGGMFQTVATAHTNSEAIGNAAADHTEHRKIWVPFHFFPGNAG